METFDWIVIGNGLAGAALSYELVKQGLSVLLVDNGNPNSATRCSYGGIGYWASTNATNQTLYHINLERHRQLSDELDATTEFRELDLLMTFAPDVDGAKVSEQYEEFANQPHLISAQEAHAIEPQLNIDAIGGALTIKHGHVNPIKTLTAFNQAFRHRGGKHVIASVTELVKINNRVTGILTQTQAYAAHTVVVAAGGYSRQLLRASQLLVPLYHTHAEIIALPNINQSLRAMVIPAVVDRLDAEVTASHPDTDSLWDGPPHEIVPPILDSGVIQFLDGSTYIGQISRFRTELTADLIDAASSESSIRQCITAQLPCLQNVPGKWRHCLVTFSRDEMPLIGPLPGVEGLQIFSGFTSPFAMLLPVAERFAEWCSGGQPQPDELLEKMLVTRFA